MLSEAASSESRSELDAFNKKGITILMLLSINLFFISKLIFKILNAYL